MSAVTDALTSYAVAAGYTNSPTYIRAECGLKPSQCGFNDASADTDFDNFINARITLRGSYVTQNLSRSCSPFAWPMARTPDDKAALFFPAYESSELDSAMADALNNAVQALAYFVEGDLYSLAAQRNGSYLSQSHDFLGMLSSATEELIPGKAQTTLSISIDFFRQAAIENGYQPQLATRPRRA